MSELLQHHQQQPHLTNKHVGKLEGAADFLKSSYISRWGIVSVSKEQSIAEHMYRVWILVRQWGPLVSLTHSEQAVAEELALTHDLAEIRTGDCPTPFKTPAVKEALTELEQSIYPELPASGRSKQFVKFCDTAESVLFLRMHGVGKHAHEVQELLAQQMWARLGKSLFSPHDHSTLIDHFTRTFHDT